MKDAYDFIVVESYLHSGGGSKHSIRCRPIKGQGLPTHLNVECSSVMRKSHPVGTQFRIRARVTNREGTPFIYTYHNWPWAVVERHNES